MNLSFGEELTGGGKYSCLLKTDLLKEGIMSQTLDYFGVPQIYKAVISIASTSLSFRTNDDLK